MEEIYKISKKIRRENRTKKKINDGILSIIGNTDLKYDVFKLTPLDGNCIFSSLVLLGYGNSARNLRKTTALIMYCFRNYKGFIPKFPEMTLKKLFKTYTDGDNKVFSYGEMKIVKYGYIVMCKDLAKSGSWTRLCPELLFLVLSRIFKVSVIIHSDQYTEAPQYKSCNDYKIEVHLGHLDNCHFVPLIEVKNKIKKIFQYKYDDGAGFEHTEDEYESRSVASDEEEK